jgi:hypothetical protein
MERSETLAELAKALVAAQAEIKGALKDSENPHLRSKYADLASAWEACRGPLTKNGLCVVQTPSRSEIGTVMVETLLIHTSGEWIKASLGLKAVQDTPQGAGSAITYARRYSLMSMVGIAPEDDDGNEASGTKRGSKEAADAVAQRKLADLQSEEQAKKTPSKITKMKAATEAAAESGEKDGKDPYYVMLEGFRQMKEIVGEDFYYNTLASFGLNKSNEIPRDNAGMDTARRIYKLFGAEQTRLKLEMEQNAVAQ